MEYRVNRRTGDRISIIGLGTSAIPGAGIQEGIDTLRQAFDHGVNYFDLATAESDTFPLFRQALADVRTQVLYQIQFEAVYGDGKRYGWTTDPDAIRRSVDWQLKALDTDYIDYGFIHCLDEADDWVQYQKNGALDCLLSLRDQGVVRHIGLSSHTPATAEQVLDSGLVDMLMFSINPAYDYHHGEFANGSGAERMALYRRCEAEGTGISVMKPFSGGQLLDAKPSPFGVALEDREHPRRGSLTPQDMEGTCVYCNHCQPCPAGLDIGLINKYYDLALAGDGLAADHYRGLAVHADACVACGHCNRRCPFHVDQVARMGEIARYFAG